MLELQNHSEVKLIISHKNPDCYHNMCLCFLLRSVSQRTEKHFAAIKVIILMILVVKVLPDVSR